MAFMEYQLSTYRQHLKVCEDDSKRYWLLNRAKKLNPAHTALEEEIHSLRKMLEQMVMEGREMTSDSVVELSTLLDRKINEYMNIWKKSR